MGGTTNRFPIYEPELPLRAGVLPLLKGLSIPGCIRDAAPDAWGRRVIMNKKLGRKGVNTDAAELGESSENEASQAMLISGNNNLSQIRVCLGSARHSHLTDHSAQRIVDNIQTSIKHHWQDVCDEAELSEVDRSVLWGRQFFNPYSLVSR